MYRRARGWGILLLLCNGFAGRVFISSLCDCMSGRKWYLLCNFFRIARQVRKCTCCAIFSVLHGRYEIVPAVQYFPYRVAGTKLYLLCNIFRIAWQVRNGTSYAFFTNFCRFFRIARQVHGFLHLRGYL